MADEYDDKDWVNITVDINDGWADDVPLVYPEDGWKPDNSELTQVEIEPAQEELDTLAQEEKNREHTDNRLSELKATDNIVKKKNKTKAFNVFLILWLGALSISIAIGLDYFYDYLEDYENAYQASRPYHTMDSMMMTFGNTDALSLYNMMTLKPEINEFETEENLLGYMTRLIEGKNIDYTETPDSSPDYPKYYLRADGYIIATVELRKDPVNTFKYDFPGWYISNFEFYTDPQFSFRVEIPSNYTLLANGVPVNTRYRYEGGITLKEKEIFSKYTRMPNLEKYYCDKFYEEPVLTAIDCFGCSAPVEFNTSRGIYEVAFTDSPERQSIEDYCVQVVTDYALYTSGDANEDILDKYYPEESELLSRIKAGTARKYFAAHSDTKIENVNIETFEMFSPETLHCKVTLDQNMMIYGQETIVTIRGDYYYVLMDGQWKIVDMKY